MHVLDMGEVIAHQMSTTLMVPLENNRNYLKGDRRVHWFPLGFARHDRAEMTGRLTYLTCKSGVMLRVVCSFEKCASVEISTAHKLLCSAVN